MECRLMYHQHNRKRADTLDYVQSMLGQLKIMAESENCDMLVYLIDIAHIEARETARREQMAGRGRSDPGG
jgi:hypothetical protein